PGQVAQRTAAARDGFAASVVQPRSLRGDAPRVDLRHEQAGVGVDLRRGPDQRAIARRGHPQLSRRRSRGRGEEVAPSQNGLAFFPPSAPLIAIFTSTSTAGLVSAMETKQSSGCLPTANVTASVGAGGVPTVAPEVSGRTRDGRTSAAPASEVPSSFM